MSTFIKVIKYQTVSKNENHYEVIKLPFVGAISAIKLLSHQFITVSEDDGSHLQLI